MLCLLYPVKVFVTFACFVYSCLRICGCGCCALCICGFVLIAYGWFLFVGLVWLLFVVDLLRDWWVGFHFGLLAFGVMNLWVVMMVRGVVCLCYGLC